MKSFRSIRRGRNNNDNDSNKKKNKNNQWWNDEDNDSNNKNDNTTTTTTTTRDLLDDDDDGIINNKKVVTEEKKEKRMMMIEDSNSIKKNPFDDDDNDDHDDQEQVVHATTTTTTTKHLHEINLNDDDDDDDEDDDEDLFVTAPPGGGGGGGSGGGGADAGGDVAAAYRGYSILWSCIVRDDIILVEAGDDPFGTGHVQQTAKGILKRKNTAGYEYHTCNPTSSSSTTTSSTSGGIDININNTVTTKNGKQGNVRRLLSKMNPSKKSSSSSKSALIRMEPPPPPKLRGIKFHLYDRNNDDEPLLSPSSTSTTSLHVWVFAAVYDVERCSIQQIHSFLEKIVKITEPLRDDDYVWRTGGTLSCQPTFAPILFQRMNEVSYLGKLSILHDQIDNSKQTMEQNIDLLLEREEKIRDMDEQHASHLYDMAKQFKKRTKKLRRIQMMQNAKHGVMIGTAVTAGVAIVVVPPLIAIL